MTDNHRPTPDEAFGIELTRRGDVWAATVYHYDDADRQVDADGAAIVTRGASDAGPAAVLEAVGQRLDEREAERLRLAHGLPAAADVAARIADGELGKLPEDVARVIEVLEDAMPAPLITGDVCRIAGFADPPHPMSSDGRARTLRALRQAEAAGAVECAALGPDTGDYVWRLVSDELVRNGDADAERRLDALESAREAEAADRDAMEDRAVDAHRRRSAQDDPRGEADR